MTKVTEWLAWIATMAIILFALSGLHQCDLKASRGAFSGDHNLVELVQRYFI